MREAARQLRGFRTEPRDRDGCEVGTEGCDRAEQGSRVGYRYHPHEPMQRRVAQLGASRICEPGALQAPPLDWRNEGRGVLLPLVRFADRDAMPAG